MWGLMANLMSEWASASVGGWHKSHALLKCVRVFLYMALGFQKQNKGCVSHTVALPFTLQYSLLLRQKKELWQILFKENQNPSRYHNSIITNPKFQHKPKSHLSKTPHTKIDLLTT